MNKSEAGSLGGQATVRKHGLEHMREIGRRGAEALWKRYHLHPVRLSKWALVNRETGEFIKLWYGG